MIFASIHPLFIWLNKSSAEWNASRSKLLFSFLLKASPFSPNAPLFEKRASNISSLMRRFGVKNLELSLFNARLRYYYKGLSGTFVLEEMHMWRDNITDVLITQWRYTNLLSPLERTCGNCFVSFLSKAAAKTASMPFNSLHKLKCSIGQRFAAGSKAFKSRFRIGAQKHMDGKLC